MYGLIPVRLTLRRRVSDKRWGVPRYLFLYRFACRAGLICGGVKRSTVMLVRIKAGELSERFENHASWLNPVPQFLLDRDDDPHCQQRVSAQIEKLSDQTMSSTPRTSVQIAAIACSCGVRAC